MPYLKPFLLFLLVLINCSLHVEAADKKDTLKRRYAVIIGIADYKQLPHLGYADKDALEFYLYLKASFPSDTNHLFLFINANAAKAAIENKLSYIARNIQAGDQVFIYFSGHGDTEEKGNAANFLFLLSDAPRKNYQLKASAILDKRFFDGYISKWISKDVKTIFVCDACHSGTLIGGLEGEKNTAGSFMQSWQGQIKILACQPTEKSYEFRQLGGGSGTFSYYLVLGLKGLADEDNNNKISVWELQKFLTDNVLKYVSTNAPGISQIPEISGDKAYIINNKNNFLLSQAKKQLASNSPSNEFLQLFKAKGQSVVVHNNTITYNSGFSATKKSLITLEKKDWGDMVNDNYFKSIYYSYQAKLEAGVILKPEKTCAYYYYTLFSKQQGLELLKNEMKIELLDALDNYYEKVLASLYNGNEATFYNEILTCDSTFFNAFAELADGNDVLLHANKSRQLFAGACRKLAVQRSDSASWKNYNFAAAASEFYQVYKLDTLSPSVLIQTGNINFMAKRYTEALDFYLRYEKQLPNDERICLKQALVYININQKDVAIKTLRKAVDLNPDYIEAKEMLKSLINN